MDITSISVTLQSLASIVSSFIGESIPPQIAIIMAFIGAVAASVLMKNPQSMKVQLLCLLGYLSGFMGVVSIIINFFSV